MCSERPGYCRAHPAATAILARREPLAAFIRSANVQTNETGRGLAWLLPVACLGWPAVHLVELGASAGLNLVAERRGYRLMDAADPAHVEQLKKMRDLAPAKFAPKPPPSFESLTALKWQPLEKEARAPASKPDGSTFEVTFLNQRGHAVKLWWMDQQQKPRFYAEIEAGKRQPQRTRPGAVWLITDAEDQALGYFEIGDRAAKAIATKVPPRQKANRSGEAPVRWRTCPIASITPSST